MYVMYGLFVCACVNTIRFQTKLLEIEEVARKLEEALRKRGDSEPPPDLTSLRSLNMSYKAKMAEDQLSHSLGSPPTTPTSSLAPEVIG